MPGRDVTLVVLFSDDVERLRVGGTGGHCFETLLTLSSVKLLDAGVATVERADALLDPERRRIGPGRLGGGGGGGSFSPGGNSDLLAGTEEGW